jgi:hypothetical protein
VGEVASSPLFRPRSPFVSGFTIMRCKIVAIDLIADPERLRQFDLTILGD